jgi:hypothetical protein
MVATDLSHVQITSWLRVMLLQSTNVVFIYNCMCGL